jgi:hypothetical protein
MKWIAGLAALACLIVPAQAATFSFETRNTQTFQSRSVVVDGTGVTAIAGSYVRVRYNAADRRGAGVISAGGLYGDASFQTGPGGLSLNSSGTDTNPQFDGFDLLDLAIFSFDETVSLDFVTFDFFDGDDDFVLFVGDDPASMTQFSAYDLLDSVVDSTGTVVLNIIGRVFAIGTLDDTDDWTLRAGGFTRLEDMVPTPLPGALPLMLTALSGLALFRRNRAARA